LFVGLLIITRNKIVDLLNKFPAEKQLPVNSSSIMPIKKAVYKYSGCLAHINKEFLMESGNNYDSDDSYEQDSLPTDGILDGDVMTVWPKDDKQSGEGIYDGKQHLAVVGTNKESYQIPVIAARANKMGESFYCGMMPGDFNFLELYLTQPAKKLPEQSPPWPARATIENGKRSSGQSKGGSRS
jgi:hypothetical protein